MAAQLSELSAAAATLNKKTETINKHIQEVNQALEGMDIGLEVWLADSFLSSEDYSTDVEERPGVRWCDAVQLGFAKVEDRWQLATRCVTAEEYMSSSGFERIRIIDPHHLCPLLKASRNDRIAAIDLLDELTSAILKKINSAVEIVDKADTNKLTQRKSAK